MGRLVQMQHQSTYFKLEGGYLFTSMDTISGDMIDIYSVARRLDKKETLTIECNFSFIDVRVKRLLMKFLKGFARLASKESRCSVRLKWKYDFRDEDMEEFGEIICESICLPIEIIQIDSANQHSVAVN